MSKHLVSEYLERWFTDARLRYCRVKAAETDALPKWSEQAEAIGLSKPNHDHRFLSYCLKLKFGRDGRRLKGIRKASTLYADWKNFRGYYRKMTRTSINPQDSEQDSEEINAVGYLPSHEDN